MLDQKETVNTSEFAAKIEDELFLQAMRLVRDKISYDERTQLIQLWVKATTTMESYAWRRGFRAGQECN